MRERIEQELAFLSEVFPGVEHKESEGQDWFLLPPIPLPPGWEIGGQDAPGTRLAFALGAAHPQGKPYGFCAPATITFKGQIPQSASATSNCPFPGNWLQFSWDPAEGWAPAADVRQGSNVVAWVRSFSLRLKEGA